MLVPKNLSAYYRLYNNIISKNNKSEKLNLLYLNTVVKEHFYNTLI